MANKFAESENTLFPKAPDSLFIDALFSSIGDGAIATDEFSRIVRINKIALDILGYAEEEVLGKWFPGTIIAVNEDGSEVNPMDRSIIKAFITGQPVSDNSYYLHKEGHKIPVSITVAPTLLNDRPIGAINLFRDITQEYEIDHIKSEFISLASHQLRTPLSSINTYSRMLLEGYMGKVSKEQKFALNAIVEASDRMNQLTDTLLNITRIEAGSVTISKKEININDIAKEVIKEQSLDSVAKNLTVRLKAPSKKIVANTDKFIAKEILTNLLSNAIKYTPEKGTVTITIKPEKEEIICSVADTGIGIPKQAQEQIFEKFFRAPNVQSRDTTGTGLGLYLIKSLAERLNIPVWFESTEGEGSTFSFSLPAATPKSDKITPQPTRRSNKKEA
jgi:two-component system sensor histidine kinase VicK